MVRVLPVTEEVQVHGVIREVEWYREYTPFVSIEKKGVLFFTGPTPMGKAQKYIFCIVMLILKGERL